MLSLSLLITCAALGEVQAAPAVTAPPPAPAQAVTTATPTATPDPTAAPAATPTAADDGGVVVAKEEPAPAAAPFVLAGFLPADRLSIGAAPWLGTTFKSVDGGVDLQLRWRGVLAGVVVGAAGWSGGSEERAWTRTLGVEAGYGLALERYRVEGALGYGKATERREPPAGAAQSSGTFLRLRLAAERAVLGGEGWRVGVGAGAWWQQVQGLDFAPADHQEFGVGLRISGELGW